MNLNILKLKNSIKLYISILALFALACSNSSKPVSVSSYSLIKPELHLGEYLQVENEDSLITVQRIDHRDNLVRVKPSTGEIQTLDETETRLRELKLSAGRIIYRAETSLRYYINKDVKTLQIPGNLEVSKLTSFLWKPKVELGRITFVTTKNQSKWATLNNDGIITHIGDLPGEVRSNLQDGLSNELLLFQTHQDLQLGIFKSDLSGLGFQYKIESGLVGSYAAMKFHRNELHIAYLDETDGTLKLAKAYNYYQHFVISRIDGKPHDDYLGMDIALFSDNDSVGILYLDAWNLKLRMARYIKGQWLAQQLPIDGAVGFYSQVLSIKDGNLKFAFHNFRSDDDLGNSTFEDLAVTTIQLINK
jgi:hypothetical protein